MTSTYGSAQDLADAPQLGFRSLPVFTRQDSSSSTGSEDYKHLPPGRYLLNLHGSCPRCHHYHQFLEVRINTTCGTGNVSHVLCEKCREKWLAFGGRNTTQLSLLSTITIEIPPVEKELRSLLIDKARPLNAADVPHLSAIPKKSAQAPHERHIPPLDAKGAIDEPSVFTGRPRNTVLQSVTAFPVDRTLASERDSTLSRHARERAGDGTNHSIFLSMKKSVKAFTMTARRMRLKLTDKKEPKMSDKKKGKLPIRDFENPVSGEAMFPPSVCSSRIPHTDTQSHLHDANEADHRPSAKAVEASQFLRNLRKETATAGDADETAIWIRQKLTDFKNLASPTPDAAFPPQMVDASTEAREPAIANSVGQVAIVAYPAGHFLLQQSHEDISGFGSHFGNFDRMLARDAISRRGSLSISESTSEAPTAIEPFAIASMLRRSASLQQERQGSWYLLDSLPSASQPTLHARHRDSSEYASSNSSTTLAVVRSNSPVGLRAPNRRSRTSTVTRTSGLAHSMSQSSLNAPQDDGETPSPPPPSSPQNIHRQAFPR